VERIHRRFSCVAGWASHVPVPLGSDPARVAAPRTKIVKWRPRVRPLVPPLFDLRPLVIIPPKTGDGSQQGGTPELQRQSTRAIVHPALLHNRFNKG